MENIWVKFTESIARGFTNVCGTRVRGLHNVDCCEMTPGLSRWSSVCEGTHFRTETLTYITYPKSYRRVEEDIWHWAPVTSQEVTTNNNRKHKLYLETLTFREVDNLSEILVHKLRSVEVRRDDLVTPLILEPSVRLIKAHGTVSRKCRLRTMGESGDAPTTEHFRSEVTLFTNSIN